MSQSRRQFLRRVLLASAATALSPMDLMTLDRPPGTLPRADGRSERVLILGAGLSGLAAAYELRQAGYDVLVLEARTRPGGRIRTLRAPFASGLHAEASAARIPESHERVLQYVDLLGLELASFQPEAPNLFYLDGQVLRGDQSDLLARAGLSDEEQQLGLGGMIEQRLGQLLAAVGDSTAEGWPGASLLRYDRMTGAALLQRQDFSEAAIHFFDAGFGLFEKISGLELLVQAPSAFATKRRIVGGTDLLPKRLAQRLSDCIRYGAPVVRIEQDANSVTAVCDRAGRFERVPGDRMICTIPFRVLRHIEITPAVSKAKRRVIDGLSYESVTRVFVQTRERFWRQQGLSGFAMTDHPMEIWDASDGQSAGRGILMAYYRNDIARQVAAMSEKERARFTVEAMADVFPDVRSQYEGAYSFVWDEDPWARGAYTTYHPGEMTRFYHALAQPEQRIHFAGEHVSPWPGWMQGALHSGIRAAHEVNVAR